VSSRASDAAKRKPRVAFMRYGNSRWATSAGRSIDIRFKRFYVFIDFGRILDGKPPHDDSAASVSEPGLVEMAWGTMRAAWREGDYDGAAAVGVWLGLFVAVLLAVLGLFVYALVEVGYAIA